MQLRSHTGCNYLLLLSTVFLFQGKWSPSKLPLLSPRLTAGKQMLGDDIYPSLLLQYIVFSKGDDDGNENADEVAMLCCNMGSAAAADGSIQMTTDNRDLPAFSHDEMIMKRGTAKKTVMITMMTILSLPAVTLGGLAFLFNNPDQWRLPL